LATLPAIIDIEKNMIKKAGDIIRPMNLGNKCLIVTGVNTKKIAGQKLYNELKKEYETDIIIGVSNEKKELESFAKNVEPYNFLVGVGGGKIMDITKYSAHLTGKPWISFPTVLSHDGIVSSRASLSDNGTKTSINAKEPRAILADYDILKEAPIRWMISGAADLISNYSAVEDWRLASSAEQEKYSELCAGLSLTAANACVADMKDIIRKNYNGVRTLLEALVLSGFAMNLFGSSRPASGSEHNFAHALEMMNAPGLHGEQCGIGTIISSYLQKKNWVKIKEHLKNFGAPTKASDIKITDEQAIEALVQAPKIRTRYTILDRYDIDRKMAKQILETVGVI